MNFPYYIVTDETHNPYGKNKPIIIGMFKNRKQASNFINEFESVPGAITGLKYINK